MAFIACMKRRKEQGKEEHLSEAGQPYDFSAGFLEMTAEVGKKESVSLSLFTETKRVGGRGGSTSLKCRRGHSVEGPAGAVGGRKRDVRPLDRCEEKRKEWAEALTV